MRIAIYLHQKEMVGFIVLLLFVCVLIGLLLMPINLYLNTKYNQYYLTIGDFVKVWLEGDKEEILKIGLKIFFYRHFFYPLRKREIPEQKKKKTKKRKTWSVRKVSSLITSFKLKRFWLDIDTGDSIMNAKLYPLFSFANYYGIPCHINFNDTNLLVVHLQNRPINMIKSFINYKT